MHDPFKLTGPTCLSFSGGSTSGYMLWRTLEANSREAIEQDLRVIFANTGCEHERTLEFVMECSARWNIPVDWVEYRDDDAGYTVVNFEKASRDGEPFDAIVHKRNYLPNPITRFCTSELKIRAIHKRLRALGWDEWDQFIGIRADEPRRVSKIRARGISTETTRETMCLPLADTGVSYRDVDEFWLRQPFRLELERFNGRTLAGNCVFCFLKPRAQIQSLMRAEPKYARPFMRIEAINLASKPSGGVFRTDRPTYAQMAAYACSQDDAFDGNEEAIACFCGD
jgi:3'-phosphoadenosine 5'-phosphosulfate sulfotransferase (PAPS reductase)/FAD synthetase